MGNIKCRKCGWQPENESHLDLHHIIPKGMHGHDKDGRFYLCRANKGNDCHRKIHIWLKKIIIDATFRWLKEDDKDDTQPT